MMLYGQGYPTTPSQGNTNTCLLAVLLSQVPLWEVSSVQLSILLIDRELKPASLYSYVGRTGPSALI